VTLSFIAAAIMALVVSTCGRAGLWPRTPFIVGDFFLRKSQTCKCKKPRS
jgi:hypothetical protein